MSKIKLVFIYGLLSVVVFSCAPRYQTGTTEGIVDLTEIPEDKGISFLQQGSVQLSPPQIFVDSVLFRESATITLDFDLEESEIEYIIGTNSPQKYAQPIIIRESTSVKVQASMQGYISSDLIEIDLIAVSEKNFGATASISPEPNETYPGNGPRSLVDLNKGTLDFKNGKHWSGFQDEYIEIGINLEKPQSLSKVYCSMLKDHNSWIFEPKEIQIWNGDELIGTKVLLPPKEQELAALSIVSISFPEQMCTTVTVRIVNLEGIPEWHPGAGITPWIFVDEIIVE